MELGFAGHLPITRPPKPIMAPLCSPEINVELNVTPEKKERREPFLKTDEQKQGLLYHIKKHTKRNVLSEPVINSTTIVSRKLKELNESKFDVPLVVKQELEKSEKLRLDIAEKASGALNYNLKDSKYTGLVSLDVSASDFELQQRKIFKERKTSENQDEPDILSCMSDDFQFESASLSCHCSAAADTELDLFIPPTNNVFKLYEHLECWKR